MAQQQEICGHLAKACPLLLHACKAFPLTKLTLHYRALLAVGYLCENKKHCVRMLKEKEEEKGGGMMMCLDRWINCEGGGVAGGWEKNEEEKALVISMVDMAKKAKEKMMNIKTRKKKQEEDEEGIEG